MKTATSRNILRTVLLIIAAVLLILTGILLFLSLLKLKSKLQAERQR